MQFSWYQRKTSSKFGLISDTKYVTSSQNTTKFIVLLYNMLHNYMFRSFLGHLQVVYA